MVLPKCHRLPPDCTISTGRHGKSDCFLCGGFCNRYMYVSEIFEATVCLCQLCLSQESHVSLKDAGIEKILKQREEKVKGSDDNQ